MIARIEFLRNNYKQLLFLILLSFIGTMWVEHIGEEGVYTISTLEMLAAKKWSYPLLLGGSYDRPALFNWLIMIPTYLWLQSEGVLQAARLVVILATMGSAFIVYKLGDLLFKDDDVALFSMFAYLSGDVLMRRGWLAYADPVFAVFVLLGVYFLWRWVLQGNIANIIVSTVFINLAVLSKTYTAFLFYIAPILYFISNDKYRNKIFNKSFMMITSMAICLPLIIWSEQSSSGGNFIYNVKQNLQGISVGSYLYKIMSFPVLIMLLSAPLSFIVVFALIKERGIQKNKMLIACFVILLLSLLPYWVVPQEAKARYLLPAMPWVALSIGYCLVNLSSSYLRAINVMIIVTIVVKLLITPWFYYQQTNIKGNTTLAAKDILRITQSRHPIFIHDSTAKELRLSAALNLQMLPRLVKAVEWRHTQNYYYLSATKNEQQELAKYYIERSWIYLYCANLACKPHID
ncbi:MAG: hypothetical protein HOI53_08525 [Francisellaceae bacterium]|jgi:hypothetical protein|nr:hypothetical protein [Francisellaceae bacterium]